MLTERNRRDALLKDVEAAAQAERAALAQVEEAQAKVAEADAARDAIDREARAAARARDEAAEAERHARWVIQQRRAAPDEGPSAERRAQVEAAIATEKRLAERAQRDRAERARKLEHERRRLDPRRGAAAGGRAARRRAAGRERGDRHPARGARGRAGGRPRRRREARRRAARVRRRGVARPRARQAARRGGHARRGPGPAGARPGAGRRRRAQSPRDEARPPAGAVGGHRSPDGERAQLHTRIERLQRRREQLGPVNPLAQQEYKEALEHVEELERQRHDLETALRELTGLIRDTDRRIKEAFEETFEAAAKNFEEVVGHLFPGGRGALRLVREDAGPRPVLGGAEEDDEAEPVEDEEAPEDKMGVEIEITPAGKSTKRLTLLSGGEKSLTALAFLFAVFLARPCPFYILDEVEAALDDLNIDRFLTLLRSRSRTARSSSSSPTRSARWRPPTRCTVSRWPATASPR